MIELINYYLVTDQAEEALRLLAVAKTADPENGIIYIYGRNIAGENGKVGGC